jgi:hypothetical protein
MSKRIENLDRQNKLLQMCRTDQPLYVDKQLCTYNIDALKEYSILQPKSKCKSLQLFVDWQSKKSLVHLLHSKTIDINTDISSYGLKHCVEKLSRVLVGKKYIERSEYCSNEEFIVAMLQAGFTCKNTSDYKPRDYKPGPNYFFNILPLLDRKPKSRNWDCRRTYWIEQLLEEMCI